MSVDDRINTIIFETNCVTINDQGKVTVNEKDIGNRLYLLFLNEYVFRSNVFNIYNGVIAKIDLTRDVEYMSFLNDVRNCRLNSGFNIFLNYGLKRGFMELGFKERSYSDLKLIEKSLATYLKNVFNYLMDRETNEKPIGITNEEIELVKKLQFDGQPYNKIYLSEAYLMYIVFLLISYANAAILCKDDYLNALKDPKFYSLDLIKFFDTIYHKGCGTVDADKNKFYEKQPINDGVSYALDIFMKTFYDGGYELTTNEASDITKNETLESISETNKFFMKNFDGKHANVIYQNIDSSEWLKIDDVDQDAEYNRRIVFSDFKIVFKDSNTNVNQTIQNICANNKFRPLTDFVKLKGGVINKYIVGIIALLILIVILIVVIIIVLNKNKNLNLEIDKLKDKEEV